MLVISSAPRLFLFTFHFNNATIGYMKFTASYKKNGSWYMGWVEEISGVNTQGKTLQECRDNLKDALALIIEVNRELNKKEFSGRKVIREPLTFALK